MKRIKTTLILILLIFVLGLTACNGTADQPNIAIKEIKIDSFVGTEFYYSQDLDLNNAKLRVIFENDKFTKTPITSDMVKGYDSSIIGPQTITITYQNFQISVDIVIKELILSEIVITEKPDKITVIEGKDLDLTGVKLVAKYHGGSTAPIPNISADMVRNFDKNKVGIQTIEIVYAGRDTSLEIEVIAKKIETVSVGKQPDKKGYFLTAAKDVFEPKGMTLIFEYDNDTVEEVDITKLAPEKVSFEYDFTIPLFMCPVIVTYDTTYKLTIYVSVGKADYQSMVMTTEPVSYGVYIDGVQQAPHKLDNFVKGEQIDLATGMVEVTYLDGSKAKYLLNNPLISIHNFDPNKVGNQIVDVVYGGNSNNYVRLYITVKEKSAFRLDLFNTWTVLGNKESPRIYIVGQKIDISNLEYQIIYNNGDKSTKEFVTLDMLSADSVLECRDTDIKTKVINLVAEGAVTSLTVIVEPLVATSLAIASTPTKDYQSVGINSLDISGGAIAVEFNNKESKYLNLEYYMLTYKFKENGEFVLAENFDKEGIYLVTVTYLGKSASFEITLSDIIVTTIEVKNAPAVPVEIFDSYTKTSAQWEEFYNTIILNVYTSDFKTEEVAAKTENIIEFDKQLTGEQRITIRYKGAITFYYVNLVPLREINLEITSYPKRTYRIGEPIETNGIVLKKVYNNGRESIIYNAQSNDKVSFVFPDMTVVGIKNVTVNYMTDYGNISAVYEIDVVNDITYTSIEIDKAKFETVEIDNQEYKVIKVAQADELNLVDIMATLNYTFINNGVSQTATSTIALSLLNNDYDSKIINPGLRTVRVTHEGVSTTFYAYVLSESLEKVEIIRKPNRLVYAEGQSIELVGGSLQLTFNSSRTELIEMNNSAVYVKSYNRNPFSPSDMPGSKTEGQVIIVYKGKELSFDVTTVKKLRATLEYANTVGFYGEKDKDGNAVTPTVRVKQDANGFTSPTLSLEYFVDNGFTSNPPLIPGNYKIKVIVTGNDYYVSSEETVQEFIIVKKIIQVTGNNYDKIYGDKDPIYTYKIEGDSVGPDGDIINTYLVYNIVNGVKVQDKLALTLSRTVMSEDVLYNSSGAVLGYQIGYSLTESTTQNPNQNDRYMIDFKPGTLTIKPREINNVVIANTSHVADGAMKEVRVSYQNTGSAVQLIAKKDVLYYKYDTETAAIGDKLDYIWQPGTYLAVVSKNYHVASGTKQAIVTITAASLS